MTWKDVTIQQFHALREIVKKHEGDTTKLSVKLLALFNGKEESHYLNMPMSELIKAVQTLSFLNDTPREPIREKYVVDGQTFILHVNVSKMPTAQYIDYVNTLQNDPENYALLLAILLIPQGKTYNEGYDIEKNALLFEEKFSWANVQAIAFFSVGYCRSTQNIR